MRFSDTWRKLTVSQLDGVAVACAALLSLACLARGAVDDGTIAVLLLCFMPMVWVAWRHTPTVHSTLQYIGLLLLGFLLVILILQQLLPGSSDDVRHHLTPYLEQAVRAPLAQDSAAWLRSVGQLVWFVMVFMVALCIGASESSSRIFLQSLLFGGAICVTMTFLLATSNGVPVSTDHSYRHGFVNPNSAASYLGVLLLLALAQVVRLLRHPVKTLHKILPDLIDELNIVTMVKGLAILFSMLLALAGMFMTGSRGGILLSLFCGFLFAALVVLKMDLHSRTRRGIVALSAVAVLGLLVWSFLNFGHVFVHKLNRDAFNNHNRFDIMAAVVPMIADHPWLGTGLGSFPSVFQQYRPEDISADGIIDKAHNSYLEFAAEMGIPALLALLLALATVGVILCRGVHERKERYVMPALGVAVWVFVGLHSMIDFPLQVPGLAAVFIALLVVCVSQTNPRFSTPAQIEHTHVRRVRIRKRRSTIKPI